MSKTEVREMPYYFVKTTDFSVLWSNECFMEWYDVSFICGLWVKIAGYVGTPSALMEIYRRLLHWRRR